MKKMLTVAIAAMVSLAAGSVFADEHGDGLEWVPVEAFACNFKEGNGSEELNAVIADWNEWMDEQGSDDYFAITMWPNYYGQRNFDFAWLGAWRDGNAMGAGTQMWVDEGQEMAGKFWDIIDCASHTQFATARMKDPVEGDEDGNFVLAFSDCTFDEDGGGMDAYRAAFEEWNAYADEHGIVGGAWVMFPIYGESQDADYHFKAVYSAPDYTTWGAVWNLYAEGHYQKESELFENVVDCDSARVYSVNVEREMAEEDEG